eukprot:m.151137 g.151137  ORF g.151137 m.151137 type:complete len:288 (+) comp11695_c0_seq1:1836-2699(+)
MKGFSLDSTQASAPGLRTCPVRATAASTRSTRSCGNCGLMRLPMNLPRTVPDAHEHTLTMKKSTRRARNIFVRLTVLSSPQRRTSVSDWCLHRQIQKLDMMQLVPVGTTARNDVASGNRTTNECLELDVSVLTESQQYRRLAEVSRSSTYVAKSMIQGMGVRAARPFKEGEMVIEYVGELVRKQISEHRERMYNLRGVGCYMFGVPNHDLVIDATMKGGPARFINHSCDPNCVSKCLVIDKQPRIVIVATRDIATDEEFCYDYKFDLDETDKVPCNCGAEKCRGFMN